MYSQRCSEITLHDVTSVLVLLKQSRVWCSKLLRGNSAVYRRYPAGLCGTGIEISVPEDSAFPLFICNTFNADIYQSCSGFEHIHRDEISFPVCYKNRISTSWMICHIFSHVMTDCHLRSFCHQNESNPLTHNFWVPDNNDIQSLQILTGASQQF